MEHQTLNGRAGSLAESPTSASIEGILARTGLGSLNPASSAAAQERALRALAEAAGALDPMRRIILRDLTIQALKKRGFESPAKLVDVTLARPTQADAKGASGTQLFVESPAPWPEVVDGSELLDEITGAIGRYAVLPEGAGAAMALWILHSYCLGAAVITPRLAIVSPTKRCGKTTVLKLLGALAKKPLTASNLTAAVLYRVVEAYAPTLLVDEADTFLAAQDELRGILNAGHDRQSAVVPRCVGDEFEPKVFHVFGAVAIAAIGKLPDTLMDRSVVIEMKRKAPGERVQKFRRRQREALAPIPRKCLRWAADNLTALTESQPVVPDELNDRAADNWEPLLAIADRVGGAWPARARTAALLLSADAPDATETGDFGVQLLGDVRAIFAAQGVDRLTTKTLLAELAGLEGRPWAESSRGRPITPRQLSNLLGRFGVKPGTIRIGDCTPKGYLAGDLADAFARYLPHDIATSATPSIALEKEAISEAPRGGLSCDCSGDENACDSLDVADVASPAPGIDHESGADDLSPFDEQLLSRHEHQEGHR
jgi:putative DNA primase/helicase